MRSAWTFHDLDDPASSSSPLRVSLTADLKHILNLEKVAGLADKEILATMNPSPLKMPQNQFKSFKFKHPAYDALTMEAQARIDEIQGKDRVWYAGAWMGHGSHEDGFTRGIQAAKLLCAQLGRQFSPFPLRDWTKPVEQQLRDRLLRNAWGSVLGLIIRILALFVQ
jgi:predicted NAD/FAD-binding protein